MTMMWVRNQRSNVHSIMTKNLTRASRSNTGTSTDTTISKRQRKNRRGGSENNLRERVAESQSRAKALEAVIDRMKRAMTKQQQDLKRKSEALERHEVLRRECQRLRRKLKNLSSSSSPPDPPVKGTFLLCVYVDITSTTISNMQIRVLHSREDNKQLQIYQTNQDFERN